MEGVPRIVRHEDALHGTHDGEEEARNTLPPASPDDDVNP